MTIHIEIEGCDAVGKTTLINAIQSKLKFKVVKGSDFSIAQQGVDKMYEYMMEIARSEENLIIDRGFISNLVYAPLFDKNKLTDEMVASLIETKKPHTFTLYLTASLDTIKNRLIARGDDYVNVEHLNDILEAYEFITDKLNSKMIIFAFNVDMVNTYQLADLIVSMIENKLND